MENILGIAEYEEVLLDNISKVVINTNYISQNKDFWNMLIFKMYEEYFSSKEQTSIRKQAKYLEIVFNCLFEFEPPVKKPKEIINF